MEAHHIVLGMGFGDEGKGVFTDFLASRLDRPVVIRFNGGHQCGHTVRHDSGKLHVFSNFGSGTFRNVPTFFSKYCTIDPTGMVREFRALERLGVRPTLLVDPLAMVTTPFDKYYNVNNRENLRHGTVGVGFGATIERHLRPYKLYAQDIFFPAVFDRKLEAVREYYRLRCKGKGMEAGLEALLLDQFHEQVAACRDMIRLQTETQLFAGGFDNYIFEGGQGILLDMDFGFFPNVTRSHTTSKNAMEMLRRNACTAPTSIYYLTRVYQTRHGNGWMSTEAYPVRLINNDYETNVSAGHQGAFRTGILDLDMLRYALQCDAAFAGEASRQMVISCLDQLTAFEYLSDGKVEAAADRDSFLQQIALFENVWVNDSLCAATIRKWR